MEVDNAKRNLRDFLSMYNQFTETCFERCVKNLNYRVLTPEEESCTTNCINKLVNVNHRQISKYMEINPLNRKLNELNTATDPSELQAPSPEITQRLQEALRTDAITTSDNTTATDNSTPATDISTDGGLQSDIDAGQVTDMTSSNTDTAAESGMT